MPSSGLTGNLFTVTATIEDKRLHEVLTFYKSLRAYNVEVHPVPPPAGLLTGPAATSEANGKRKGWGMAGEVRAAITAMAAAEPHGQIEVAEIRKQFPRVKGAVNNVLLALMKEKKMRRVGYGVYKPTAKLLASHEG